MGCKINRFQSQSNHTPLGTRASTLSIQPDIFASTARASTMPHAIYRLATQGANARLAAARLDAGASVVGVPEPDNLTLATYRPAICSLNADAMVHCSAPTLATFWWGLPHPLCAYTIPDLLMFSKSFRLLSGNQCPPPAFHPPSPPNTTSASRYFNAISTVCGASESACSTTIARAQCVVSSYQLAVRPSHAHSVWCPQCVAPSQQLAALP